MSNKTDVASKFLVLLLVHYLFSTSAGVATSDEETGERIRRKVGNYEGPGPLEYMKQLQQSMSSADGVPNDLDHTPTSIWCLLDRDVLEDNHHPKSPNRRCQLEQTFLYNITGLIKSNSRSLPLSQGKLRLYLQPIERLIPVNSSVAIEVSIFTRTKSSVNETSCSGSVLAAKGNITIDQSTTADWSEWNITDGLLDCWEDNMNRDTLEVTVKFQLHKCVKGFKKVPVWVVDPATIPVSKKTRRDRHWPLQPIVVMFLDDAVERAKIKAASTIVESDEPQIQTTSGDKNKRSIETCELHGLNVSFHFIGMKNVLYPLIYNANQCSGGCTEANIQHSQATNHARLVASMYDEERNKVFKSTIKEPSCVAVSYLPKTLLEVSNGLLKNSIYPNMIATGCACRA